jgi:2-keto-4-pentenoate hydratase/2-oxohepta-3-ene-1,7-dioic acid hydratase in catechol pathway
MFRLVNLDGRAALASADHAYDLASLSGDAQLADPMIAVRRFAELHDLQARAGSAEPTARLTDVVLGPPVPRPSKSFGIGLNYKSHAAESNMELPPAPLTFTKFPSCIAGPTADIELSGEKVDWEVEIVAVIGIGGRRIAEERAWDHVAGLTLGQDVSDRQLQMTGRPPQFNLGKSYDGYGPIGPALVSVDSFADRDDIELWCDVSGERMQHARSRDLIFPIPYLVSYLSSVCTLEPGDVIFTGTPEGVGMARGRFLRAGDVIESGAEVIGRLRNRCVAATR